MPGPPSLFCVTCASPLPPHLIQPFICPCLIPPAQPHPCPYLVPPTPYISAHALYSSYPITLCMYVPHLMLACVAPYPTLPPALPVCWHFGSAVVMPVGWTIVFPSPFALLPLSSSYLDMFVSVTCDPLSAFWFCLILVQPAQFYVPHTTVCLFPLPTTCAFYMSVLCVWLYYYLCNAYYFCYYFILLLALFSTFLPCLGCHYYFPFMPHHPLTHLLFVSSHMCVCIWVLLPCPSVTDHACVPSCLPATCCCRVPLPPLPTTNGKRTDVSMVMVSQWVVSSCGMEGRKRQDRQTGQGRKRRDLCALYYSTCLLPHWDTYACSHYLLCLPSALLFPLYSSPIFSPLFSHYSSVFSQAFPTPYFLLYSSQASVCCIVFPVTFPITLYLPTPLCLPAVVFYSGTFSLLSACHLIVGTWDTFCGVSVCSGDVCSHDLCLMPGLLPCLQPCPILFPLFIDFTHRT